MKSEAEQLYAKLQSMGVNINALRELQLSEEELQDLVTGVEKLVKRKGLLPSLIGLALIMAYSGIQLA